MKRILTFILTLTLALSFCVNSFAAATTATASETQTGTSEAQTDTSKTQADTSEAQTDTSKVQAGASYGISNLSGAPDIVAESAVVMDANTGTILYGKEADTKRYPASITKVMTALLAVENCKMSDVITYSNAAVNGIEAGSSTAGINVGAKLTVEDSLYALMLVSANEAAAAIAEHISGSTTEFAKLMTKRAKELGCTNTQFKNPHGLPNEEHYTTAHDMGLILKEAMKHEEFRKISGTISYTLKKSDTLKDTLELWNHAKILRENSDYYYKYAEGAKTGFTQVALNTLVTYAKKDNVELICVILKDYGADKSYTDTANLFKWAFNQVKSITPLTDFSLKTAMTENSSSRYGYIFFCWYDSSYSSSMYCSFFSTSLSINSLPSANNLFGRKISSNCFLSKIAYCLAFSFIAFVLPGTPLAPSLAAFALARSTSSIFFKSLSFKTRLLLNGFKTIPAISILELTAIATIERNGIFNIAGHFGAFSACSLFV